MLVSVTLPALLTLPEYVTSDPGVPALGRHIWVTMTRGVATSGQSTAALAATATPPQLSLALALTEVRIAQASVMDTV